jgi:hypothetical protein
MGWQIGPSEERKPKRGIGIGSSVFARDSCSQFKQNRKNEASANVMKTNTTNLITISVMIST